MPLLSSSLFVLAITGVILWLAKPHRYVHSGWLAALVPAAIAVLIGSNAFAETHAPPLVEIYQWIPSLGISFTLRLDGLSLLFALIITGIGAAVALYTGYYFEGDERQGHFYLLLFAFMASMLGLVLSDNLLLIFVFWELTSITSYLMIAFNSDKRAAREGARRALIVTGLGGLAMLGGFVLFGMMAQEMGAEGFSLSAILTTLSPEETIAHRWFVPTLILIALGAFTKSAQFPFHFWLPGAMEAPTPASAYLHSATMVKAGIFLLARLHPLFAASPVWWWLLIGAGGITMVLGAVSALRYRDLKAVLAFATVSQLGIFVMLLGMPVEYAPTAVIIGIVAHALYKAPMFLSAGIIDHATGTRDLDKLRGLMRLLPWVAVTVALAAISMAGLPPTLGFVGKEALLESEFEYVTFSAEAQWSNIFSWVLWGATIISAAFSAAVAFMVFWEPFASRAGANVPEANAPVEHESGHDEHSGEHAFHAPRFGFVLPALTLAALGIVLALTLVNLDTLLIYPAATAVAGIDSEIHLALWHGVTPALLSSAVALALGAIVFWQRKRIKRLLDRSPIWLSGIYAFGAINHWLYAFATELTRRVQGGSMARQIGFIFIAAMAMVAYALLHYPLHTLMPVILPSEDFNIDTVQALLSLLAVVAAVTAVRATNRLGAIISLGVVGVVVTLYFVLYSAPDLALTQLLVEILTVVLLVLVFFRVRPDALPPLGKFAFYWRAAVAIAVGLTGTALALINTAAQEGRSISPWFVLHAGPDGEGANIVNVILVDFRGYDTLGEITVLAIAAVGGFAMLRAPRMKALVAAMRSSLLKREGTTLAAAAAPDATPAANAPATSSPASDIPAANAKASEVTHD